jgi:hypothetical protein
MIEEVKAILDDIVGNATHLKHAEGSGRTFELFLMAGIAAKLRDADRFPGVQVAILRSNSKSIKPDDEDRVFIQRAGTPSGLPDPAAGAGNMSTLLVSLEGRRWEFWNGVQFIGRSGGMHEFDIALVPSDVGCALRLNYTDGRPMGRPDVAIECKNVAKKAQPDDVRALIARLYDCTFLSGDHRPAPYEMDNRTSIHPKWFPGHDALRMHARANKMTLNIFAHTSGLSEGAAALTEHYGIHYPENVASVAKAEKVMDVIAEWIFTNLLNEQPARNAAERSAARKPPAFDREL